VRVNLKSGV